MKLIFSALIVSFSFFVPTSAFAGVKCLSNPIEVSAESDKAFQIDLNTFVKADAPGPLLWAAAHELPSFLALNANGTISGTPSNNDISPLIFDIAVKQGEQGAVCTVRMDIEQTVTQPEVGGIVGNYVEANVQTVPLSLVVDKNYLARTDLEIYDGHQKSRLNFPQPIQQSNQNQGWTTLGQFTFVYSTPHSGPRQCFYSAQLDLRPAQDPNFLDVTFTIPLRVGIDSLGRCLSHGAKYMNHVFRRVSNN